MGGKNNTVKQTAIVILSLFVFGFVCEAVVRIVSHRILIYNIEMVKYSQKLKQPDPLGEISHVHRPNSQAKLMGVMVKLNSMGNRSDVPFETKSTGVNRVLVMGSSVTMGWGVSKYDVFTAVADKQLRSTGHRFDIINAGIGNYNTHKQWVLFNRQYPQIMPDKVVLHYFINDAEQSSTEKDSAVFKHLYLASFLYDWFVGIQFRFSHKENGLAHYYQKLYRHNSSSWQQTLGYINSFKRFTDKNEASFVVMIVPDFHQLSQESPYAAIYDKISTEIANRGITAINLFPEFQKQYGHREQELWIQADDPHPNEKGHDLMAKYLVDYLVPNQGAIGRRLSKRQPSVHKSE